MQKLKKIGVAFACGVLILLVTWKYQNYDYTFNLEENFFKKVSTFRDKVYSPPPKRTADFVFINTGKDLTLIEDTIDYGNVAISDREKILQLFRFLNVTPRGPRFCVLDIQFYYPYNIQPSVDSMLQRELTAYGKVVLPVVKNPNGLYAKPIYTATYGHSNYRTFGSAFNKFRILIQEEIKSIPIVMHEKIDKAKYLDHFYYPTCNGRLCLSAIWPTYYLKDSDLKKSTNIKSLEEIEGARQVAKKTTLGTAEYLNLGELLFDIEANPDAYLRAFENKIMIIGNFQEDVHVTPIGKISGPLLLANLYLSLLNHEHLVSPWLLLLMVASFSGLSYVAIYKKMPELNIKFKFMLSSFLTKFIKSYVSYFGAMFAISLVAFLIFNVQIALFMPSAIFTGIEYIKAKKYLELKN